MPSPAMNGSQSSEVKFAGSQESVGSEKTKWWSFRQVQILILVLVVCAVLSLALIIALAVVVSSDNNADTAAQTQDGTCMTTDCVVAASRVAQSIDFTVNPCNDFYTYACGKWMEKHFIPDDSSEINTFALLRDEVEVILKNLMEDNQTFTDEVFKKSRDLYSSCMDLVTIENRADKPLKDFIAHLGGWPLLTDGTWNEANFDLTDRLYNLSLFNNQPLASLYVNTDLKNSSARILYMDQPGWGLPGRKYYLVPRNDTILAAYEALMRNVATQLGAQNQTHLDADVKAVVDFEIHLANISVPDEDRRDSEALYNKYTLTQLMANFTGAINWRTLLNSIYNHEDVKVPLAVDEPIVNRSPPYFYRMLQALQTTPNRTVANFLMWRIVMNRINQLDTKYRGFVNEYNKVVYGTATERPRFRVCASYATTSLGLAVGHMFVKKAFDEEAKDQALSMIKQLKIAFNELLADSQWMDEDTKVVAREKNEYIDEKIGYPDEVLNITHLTSLYENYTYDAGSYFENVLKNIQESARSTFRTLREPVDRNQWTSPPSTVNAFYNSLRNQIMFPAGILQPPFFSKAYPKSLNYGGIGVVIGHEITHGFDDRGRQYDKDGNLEQWWSDSAIERFKERAQCIVNQYGNFTVPEADMNLNGIQTQGENIADNGGLRQSYKAYRNWIRDARQGVEEALLPGLNFTNDQLFFVNFAQIWCTNMRRESAVNRILTGVHSPGRFRVIGSLQNSEDFAAAFKCKRDTEYMHPAKKCVVW